MIINADFCGHLPAIDASRVSQEARPRVIPEQISVSTDLWRDTSINLNTLAPASAPVVRKPLRRLCPPKSAASRPAADAQRWSPRGAHLMLQVRTATVNAMLEADHGSMSWRRRSFRMAA